MQIAKITGRTIYFLADRYREASLRGVTVTHIPTALNTWNGLSYPCARTYLPHSTSLNQHWTPGFIQQVALYQQMGLNGTPFTPVRWFTAAEERRQTQHESRAKTVNITSKLRHAAVQKQSSEHVCACTPHAYGAAHTSAVLLWNHHSCPAVFLFFSSPSAWKRCRVASGPQLDVWAVWTSARASATRATDDTAASKWEHTSRHCSPGHLPHFIGWQSASVKKVSSKNFKEG